MDLLMNTQKEFGTKALEEVISSSDADIYFYCLQNTTHIQHF